jgi:hypothetical protein
MRTPSILLATGLLAACAAPGENEPAAVTGRRQCFHSSQVNGFNAIDRDTVYVRVGTRGIYELDIVGTCPEIDFTQRIAIRPRGTGNFICQGLDAELIVPAATGLDRCPVLGVRRLSDAEVKAYRGQRRR